MRRERLGKRIVDAGVDALLVSNERNVSYLTGFSGDSSYLLLGREKPVLISDARYAEQIQQECAGLEAYVRPTTGEKMSEAASHVAANMRIRRLAFESSHLTVAQLGDLQAQMANVEFIGWVVGSSPIEHRNEEPTS